MGNDHNESPSKLLLPSSSRTMLDQNAWINATKITTSGIDKDVEINCQTSVLNATAEVATGGDLHDIASHQTNAHPVMTNRKNRVPYASLFKNNRMAHINYKLEFVDTGNDKLKFGLDDIDTVEKTYGICLLGYVISGKPPTAALFDLVRRWGPDIKFQTHESGWIVFTFPSVDVRDRILSGGSYMVFGFHLFLKEMPRCFRFRDEDMSSLPVWVQIHGLPPDCWNANILSKLASRVGNPIHMDMLTHDRKRVKYARVLIEIEASAPKVTDIVVELPIGDVEVKFGYEQDIKFCENCKIVGHSLDNCTRNIQGDSAVGANNVTARPPRSRSRSVVWRKGDSRGRSRVGKSRKFAPSRDSSLAPTGNASGTMTTNIVEPTTAVITTTEINNGENNSSIDVQAMVDKGKKPMTSEVKTVADNCEGTDETTDEFEVVSNKKKNKKKKKKKEKTVDGHHQAHNKTMATFFEGMEESSSCDTEFVSMGNGDKNVRFFGKQEMGRQPEIASGYQ